ncbi:MAG: c-type cytochrome domain-containing protein, partial [Roseibacillus sp.]|nr:c-type cytochrome domain-containing protein [Roseibacillus sp.]
MRHTHGFLSSLALTAIAIFPIGFVHGAEGDNEGSDRPVSYWNDVRPLMQASCQGCHQPAKAKGDYILTDVKRLIEGGESDEAAVLPGKPDESLLIEQIIPDDEGKAEMPPKEEALHETEIDLLRRWIAEGAVDDTPENAFQKYDMKNPPVYAVPPVVTSMDYSPDGSLLAVAGFHEILIHKADGSELVGRLVGLSERIESVAFSPDGSMVAATGGLPGRMGEVQVWNVAKKTLKVSVPVTYDTVYGVAWSPDSKLVSFGCSDNTLRAIQVSNGKQVLFMGGHNDWVLDSVFSRDG